MQKFKQAFPFKDRTDGYETDVVGRCFLACIDFEWQPVTAWLNAESNVERTVVTVVVGIKFRKLLKRIKEGGLSCVSDDEIYESDGKTLSFRLCHFLNVEGYGLMVHKDAATKRVTVLFTNKLRA